MDKLFSCPIGRVCGSPSPKNSHDIECDCCISSSGNSNDIAQNEHDHCLPDTGCDCCISSSGNSNNKVVWENCLPLY